MIWRKSENRKGEEGMLTGKVAVVTGASRGIGREIARTLAAAGAAVIVNYNGSAQRAEDTVGEIEENGGRAEAMQCDVSDFESAGKLIETVVKKYGRIDILVNNAADGKAEGRQDYQYFFGVRSSWQCGAGELRGFQGRNYRHDQVRGQGAGKQRDYGQCHCTGIY